MRLGVLMCGAAAAAGCGEAFSSRVDVVARAGEYELDVGRLAEIIATGKDLPVQRAVVDGLAQMWINYTLFADALALGDSLLDSATVVKAKWPDIQQDIASGYHELLAGDAARLDSAGVDSAYRAGHYRYVRQILQSVPGDAPVEIRQMKGGIARQLLGQLRSGTPWEEAVQATEEPGGKERGGSLGVIGRGETVEAFENAAFALAPGELSEIIETSYGYHIIYRPPLADVFDEYKAGVEARLAQDFDQAYLETLPETWHIEVRSSALPAAREVANDPMRAKRSRTVIATFRGGAFRVADFARWLQAMPTQFRQQVPAASDSQMTVLIGRLVRNEVLLREAEERGISTSSALVEELRDELRRELALMAAALGLTRDTLETLRTAAPEVRRATVRVKVIDYLLRLSRNAARLQLVPPFLADELLSRYEWEIVPAGVEQTLARARRLRGSLDSAAARAPAPARPPGDTLGGGRGS